MNYILNYFKSLLVRVCILFGFIMYLAYAVKDGQWGNPYLICLTTFIAGFMPYYTKISDWLEQRAFFYTGNMSAGKLARFLPQCAFNIGIISILLKGSIIEEINLRMVGGVLGAAAITTAASQGMQYVAIALSNRDIGGRYFNITLALSSNIIVTAMAALGISWAQKVFIVLGIIFGFIGVVYSIITDMMAWNAPKGGIGVFFGTFNPIHNGHVEIMKKFIEERNVEKVYIHPTIIPKMHRKFLKEGLIRIAKIENGMRFYEHTEKSDMQIDYFPTGRNFYEVENRIAMIEACIKDNDLQDRVEAVYYPEAYEKDGFYAVIKEIKAMHPGKKIHGLHGTDEGGMMIRSLYDEAMGIWPYSVLRRNNISGTAVRNGAKGMTSKTVEEIIELLKNMDDSHEGETVNINEKKYTYSQGRLIPVKAEMAGSKISV